MSLEEAEKAKDILRASPLDEDSLGLLEEDIRTLGWQLKNNQPEDVTAMGSEFRLQLKWTSSRWPRLRATAVVMGGVDFSLIPRAMQAEEDLIK